IGLFGLAEIVANLSGHTERSLLKRDIGSIWPSIAVLRGALPAMLRGTVLGTFFGILPGTGPTIAAFSAYALEKKVADDPTKCGHGAIEGVAGPESANNAAAQTSFIPTLTLGIPGNATMALF